MSDVPGAQPALPMEFMIHHLGRDLGPYFESEVRSRLASGAISLNDLYWHDGATEWKPLSAFEEFVASSRPKPPPIPAPPPAELSDSSRIISPLLDRNSLGPYTRATLQPNERALHKTTIHWMVLVLPIMAALFALILIVPVAMIASWKGYNWAWLLLVIPLAIVATAAVTVKASELVITERRVLIKVGFIQRQTFEMFISKIEAVGVVQGMFGKMLDYGTVEIRGTGGSSESFTTIVAPLQFRDAIQLAQSSSKKSRLD